MVFAKCHLVQHLVRAGAVVIGQGKSSEEVTFEGGERPPVQRLGAERTACANILQRKSRALNLFKVQGKPPLGFGRRMTYLCLRSHLWPLAEWSPPPVPAPSRGASWEGYPLVLSAGVTGLRGGRRGGVSLPPPRLLAPHLGKPLCLEGRG